MDNTLQKIYSSFTQDGNASGRLLEQITLPKQNSNLFRPSHSSYRELSDPHQMWIARQKRPFRCQVERYVDVKSYQQHCHNFLHNSMNSPIHSLSLIPKASETAFNVIRRFLSIHLSLMAQTSKSQISSLILMPHPIMHSCNMRGPYAKHPIFFAAVPVDRGSYPESICFG